ncbi:MAG TPA: nuclear transport factor 2 family protein [Bryobacteraceae bacterium]|nr:nuclear transport factor 2 family protein [Bryobacteraceae bacterium]
MSIRESVEKLIQLVERGQFLEAIQNFYAPDASMQENSQPPRAGLPALLENERKALARFKILHQHRAASYVVEGNRAAINWVFEITEQSGKRYILDEIAYQEWQDGKIVKERFYYDPGQRQAG